MSQDQESASTPTSQESPPPSAEKGESDFSAETEALHKAQAAFERGDYSAVQTLLSQHKWSNEENAREASLLVARLRPGPLSVYLFALTFAFLILVTVFAYTR